jgi:hypothetical protein
MVQVKQKPKAWIAPAWKKGNRARRRRTMATHSQSKTQSSGLGRFDGTARKAVAVGGCERGDLNPHALRHRILSPARLPFRHSRASNRVLKNWKRLKSRPPCADRSRGET